MRAFIINTLNKLGYQEIVEASNGREGIDKLGSADVDMVITDEEESGIGGSAKLELRSAK